MTSFGTSLAGASGATFGVPVVQGVTGVMAKTLGAITLSGAGTVEDNAESDPYPLYTALDLNDIPFHVDAGGWGDRIPIVAPTLPTTTREVTVNTRGEFETQAAIAGTKITIGTGWATNTNAVVTASDIEVVLPSGLAIGAIQLGSFDDRVVQRFYLHGTTPGTHSGGRMGQLRDFYNIINSGVTVTDVVLDGVDMNADSGFGVGAGAYEQFRVSCARLAVLHCRVIAPGYTWLGGATHVVIADCNFYHGAATRAAVGYVEGWGIRNHAGPFVIIDSRIDGTRYHNLRPNSTGGTEELLYCARNTFVARCEGKTAWAWNNLALGDYTAQGAWFIDNDIYGYTAGGCTGQAEISVANVQYSRINDNRFYSSGGTSWTQGVLDGYTAGGGGGGAADHANSGNSFAAWTVDPAWSGPGDPRDVPMIAGFGAVISGEGSCTGWVP